MNPPRRAMPPNTRLAAWRKPLRVGAVTFLIGMMITTVSARWLTAHDETLVRERMEIHAQRLIDFISLRMREFEGGVRATRGAILIGGQEHISQATFTTFLTDHDIKAEYPGVMGFGFVRRVPHASLDNYLREVRSTIDPNFKLTKLAPDTDEHFILQLMEPRASNRKVAGFDNAAEPNRRAAAIGSMRSGKPILTVPMPHFGFADNLPRISLLMLPVYRPELPLTTVAQREAAAIGWATGAMMLDDLLSGTGAHSADFNIRISDVTNEMETPFFQSAVFDPKISQALSFQQSLPVFNRQWRVFMQPTASTLDEFGLRHPAAVWLTGLIISLLAGGLSTAVALDIRRRRALSANKKLLSALIENSTDAIIAESLDGTVISWNSEAEIRFGYTLDDAIGKPLTELIRPADRAHEDAEILDHSAQGERVPAFDTVCKRRDGELVDIAIAGVPIRDDSDQVIGVALTLQDISARKMMERALHQSKAQLERDLQVILDAMPSLISYWDQRLINRFANHAHESWYGVPVASLPGTHMQELLGPDLFELSHSHIEQALHGVPVQFERSQPRPDGRGLRHTMVYYMPDIEQGEVKGFYALVNDITELTDSKQRLASLLRDNEAVLNALDFHSMLSITDPSGKITFVNDAFCAVSGYSRDEVLGGDHRMISSKSHPGTFWRTVWRTISCGSPWHGEFCNMAKGGSLFWVNATIYPVLNELGKVEKYISICSDITATKLAQRRIADSEAFLERAAELAHVGGFCIELNTGRQTWTRQAYLLHDMDPSTPLTSSLLYTFAAPEIRAQFNDAVQQARNNGASFDLEVPVSTARGRSIWVRTIGKVEYEDDRPARIVGAIQDVTQRRQMEQALQVVSEVTKRINQANRNPADDVR